ncbi:MAG: nucleotidyltransferase family protein [Archangiaceae bacterium]|nr:nucleotidyltransferase family protein [Archangiaceae bacterium]
MLTLVDLFRALSSFSPQRQSLAQAPWDEFVDWAVPQGLAPLAAYNLEYRFAGGGAPDWARDRLLGIYQGLLNDNVMKLVNFKRSIDGLEGRRVVMLGAATFAESLYPHVAFRPVGELRLLLSPLDLDGFTGFIKGAEFKPTEAPKDEAGLAPDLVLSDTRTAILVYGHLTHDPAEDQGLLARAQPARVYGPSMYRLGAEDALLTQVLFASRAGFDVPFIEWVDLRELALQVTDPEVVKARARAWKVERALYAALHITARLFPEVAPAAAKLAPEVGLAVRKLLEVSVIDPVAVVGKKTTARPAEALRAALTA